MKENIINGFNFSDLPVTIDLVGMIKDKDWPHYLYRVTLMSKNGYYTLPYKTGLGWVTGYKDRFGKDIPKYPRKSDVMYSLLLDSEAASQSFTEWCDNYGQDSDKISSLNTYDECVKIGHELPRYFSKEQLSAMRDALQDY